MPRDKSELLPEVANKDSRMPPMEAKRNSTRLAESLLMWTELWSSQIPGIVACAASTGTELSRRLPETAHVIFETPDCLMLHSLNRPPLRLMKMERSMLRTRLALPCAPASLRSGRTSGLLSETQIRVCK